MLIGIVALLGIHYNTHKLFLSQRCEIFTLWNVRTHSRHSEEYRSSEVSRWVWGQLKKTLLLQGFFPSVKIGEPGIRRVIYMDASFLKSNIPSLKLSSSHL